MKSGLPGENSAKEIKFVRMCMETTRVGEQGKSENQLSQELKTIFYFCEISKISGQ